jgi:Rieske 2Fe-2S family protein
VANVSEWAFSKQAMKSASFWNNFGLSGKYKANDAQSEDDPMASGDFTAEDIYACEQQQASLLSPYFETGPAAQGESPVIEHQKVVLKWLGEE